VAFVDDGAPTLRHLLDDLERPQLEVA
jgi:hypothetical protein